MEITNKAYSQIAAASKRICDSNGYGHQVVIWPDYTWSEATDSNTLTGRQNGPDVESPLCRIHIPMSAERVRESLEMALRNLNLAV